MAITLGDFRIDAGHHDITPEQERELDEARHAAEAGAARNKRVEGYASWLADDVDGLISAVAPREGAPSQHSTAILAEARAVVALALSKIDLAIERDKEAHSQEAA
ncbi:hypothetical protein [Bradyrhizobium sp. USDA 4452]